MKVGSVCYLLRCGTYTGQVVWIVAAQKVREVAGGKMTDCYLVAAHWLPRTVAMQPQFLMRLDDPEHAPAYVEPKCPAYTPAKPRPASYWARPPLPDIWQGYNHLRLPPPREGQH